jgi:N-acetyl-anhydromuramyl-L-alanine amidase AmpD
LALWRAGVGTSVAKLCAPSTRSIPLIGLLVALVIAEGSAQPVLAATPTPSPAAGTVASAFRSAATEFGVPEELLLAVGYVNTRWRMETSEDGGVGTMHLIHDPGNDTLAKAASLTSASDAALGQDMATNIRGGAAVLSAAAGNPKPVTLNDWRQVVSSVGGGAMYAEQVFLALRKGARETLPGGEQVVLAAHPDLPAPAPAARAPSPDYGSAAWVPASSSNFTASSRPSVYIPNRIVIHVTQGSYAGAIGYFQNPSAQASAHYVMRSSDGAATQSVRERDVAWHAGNWDYNTKSFGIEHEGFVDNPSWFTDAMYRASAQLAASQVRKYSIPVDRQHIIGHNEVPDPLNPALTGGRDHHSDPGRFWNWGLYMSYVQAYAGSYCAVNGGGSWQRMPGGAYDVGAGGTGASWVVGTDPAVGGYGIYHWTGSSWSRSGGAGLRLAVDPAGVPWVVNASGDIYKLAAGGVWQHVSGLAMDIAIASDGSTWVIATDDTLGGFGVYQLTGAGWLRIQGGGTRIAAGPNGNLWVVNSWGAIYERTTSGWRLRPGAGYDIGITAGRGPTVVGTNRVCGGYGLWTWNGSAWTRVPGAGIGVSVDPGGKPSIVNDSQVIYRQA